MAFSAVEPQQKLAELAREKLGPVTFQSPSMIEGMLRDVVNVAPPWTRASLALTDAKEKWTPQRVKGELGEVVERRHRIAHAGDLRPVGDSARPITVAYVQSASRLIRAVGEAVCDEVDELLRELRRVPR